MGKVLAVSLAAGAVLWTAAVLSAPFAPSRGGTVAACATLVYQAGARVCHQRPERSFHLAGEQLPVCARCLGLYVSGTFAALGFFLVAGRGRVTHHPVDSRSALALAALPTVATVALELLDLAHPSNVSRAVASLPLGAVGGWVFVRSLWTEKAASVARRGATAL